MFAVVEKDQCVLLPQAGRQGTGQIVGVRAEPERRRERLLYSRAVRERGEIQEPQPVRILVHQSFGQADRQTRLPATARPDKRDEPRFTEEPSAFHKVLIASDKARWCRGKVVGNRPSLRSRMAGWGRSEEHTSELQSLRHLVCRLLLEKKKIMR